VGEPAVQLAFGASPDGKSVALCRAQSESTNRDIWIVDLASGASRRLTFDPQDDCGPLWSPDGKEIAFFSNRRGVREIYRKRADGSGDEERILPSRDLDFSPEDWSSDGRLMVLNVPRGGVDKDLYVLDLGAGGEARAVPFLATPAVEHQGRLSPNRRWVAYMSNESGIRMQVYVREVTREGRAGPGKWQVSHEVGFNPRWRRDGRELFFEGRGGEVMAVDVKTDGPAFEAGEPKTLGWGHGGADFLVTASADGERLLFDVPVRIPEPIRVLVNWLP
jgi:Tol biopolymer transport system component